MHAAMGTTVLGFKMGSLGVVLGAPRTGRTVGLDRSPPHRNARTAGRRIVTSGNSQLEELPVVHRVLQLDGRMSAC